MNEPIEQTETEPLSNVMAQMAENPTEIRMFRKGWDKLAEVGAIPFEVAERIVKARLAEALENLQKHPEHDYPSVSLQARESGIEWCVWVRVVSPSIYTYGKTIEEAFSKLPTSEEAIKLRIAEAKKKVAKGKPNWPS